MQVQKLIRIVGDVRRIPAAPRTYIERTHVWTVMVAATLGLGGGWYLTRNYDRVDAAVSRVQVAPLLVAGNHPVRGLQAAYSF